MAKKKKENETSQTEPQTGAPENPVESSQPEAGSESEAATGAERQAISSCEEELSAARGEAAKNWDLYVRSQADLDNYRKRVQREKEDLARFANEGILREILPVIDNLERAIAHAAGEQGNGGLMQGIEMTLGQFQRVLDKFGVTPINAIGEPFDPARHEAIGQIESSQQAPNTVMQELQKGYLLNDRLLRPALVMVAKAPPQP